MGGPALRVFDRGAFSSNGASTRRCSPNAHMGARDLRGRRNRLPPRPCRMQQPRVAFFGAGGALRASVTNRLTAAVIGDREAALSRRRTRVAPRPAIRAISPKYHRCPLIPNTHRSDAAKRAVQRFKTVSPPLDLPQTYQTAVVAYASDYNGRPNRRGQAPAVQDPVSAVRHPNLFINDRRGRACTEPPRPSMNQPPRELAVAF